MSGVVVCRGQKISGDGGAAPGYSWAPTESAEALDKARLRQLLAAGDLPAFEERLAVRVLPGATDWSLTVRGAGFSERRFSFSSPASLGGEPCEVQVVCATGSGEVADFPWVTVLDVTGVAELTFTTSDGDEATLRLGGAAESPTDAAPSEPPPPAEAAPPEATAQVHEVTQDCFHDGSGLVLPVSLPALTACLRDSGELVVVGHTGQSDALSEERVRSTRACMSGDRAGFVAVAAARRETRDLQRYLTWAASAFGIACDPQGVDGIHGPNTSQALAAFQRGYNDQGRLGNAAGKDLVVDGLLGPNTWGAFFDATQARLAEDLGTDLGGLAALQARVGG